jgi:hypothetical protein
LLYSLILSICNHALTFEDKRECQAQLVNCAIVQDGKILSRKDFDRKCLGK